MEREKQKPDGDRVRTEWSGSPAVWTHWQGERVWRSVNGRPEGKFCLSGETYKFIGR